MAEINISNLGGGGGGTLTLTTTGTGGASTYVAGVLNIPVYQSALTNPVTGTGTATRVAFWDSASSVSSSANLYWDNSNSFLGVGTATPGARLQVNGTGLLTATAFAVKDSGGTDSFTVADNGNTSVRGVLTISGSSASNSDTLMGRTSAGEVTSVTLGTNLSFSGNTLNSTGGGTPAGSTGEIQFNNAGAFGASSNLFWNNAAAPAGQRLGVNTSSPSGSVQINGLSAVSGGTTLSLRNNLNSEYAVFRDDGGWNLAPNISYDPANRYFNAAISTTTASITLGNLNTGFDPSIAISNSRATLPNFGVYSRGTKVIGLIQTVGQNEGCMIFNGYSTSTAPTFSPMIFVGYHGSTSPTAAACLFAGFKHLSTSPNRQILADSEVIAAFANGTNTPLISYLGNGNVNIGRASSVANTARLQLRGSNSSSGTNALLIENSTPSTLFQIENNGATTLNGTLAQNGTVTMSDGSNIAVGSTNGTKIGTATTQKIGFYNATPIVRPGTGVAEAAFVAGTGTAVNDNSTFGGYTLQQVVQALQNLGLLA